MRYGIFSDVHGNLQALEAVLRAYRKERIDGYFFAGDVVGYGANPHECIQVINDLGAVCIAGNHDWAVIGKIDTWYFNSIAKEAVLWTKQKSSQQDFDFLNKLKLVEKSKDFILVHGTLQEPSYFHYLADERQAEVMFRLMDRDVCFVGHSHVPGVFIKNQKGQIRYFSSQEVKLEEGFRYIVNVGSVGQPRDNNPMAAYCIFDTEEKVVLIKRANYDVEEAQQRILSAGLPAFLASRLAQGR